MKTVSTIQTKEASSYIRKLCKHFSEKVPATYTETEGSVQFPFGDCSMTADSDALTISITIHNEEDAAKAEDVVVRHLVKFAWREQLDISWNHQP